MGKFVKQANLADALGVENSYINVYVKLKKITINSEGLIDIDDIYNKKFIQYLATNGHVLNNKKLKIIKKTPPLIIGSTLKSKSKKEKEPEKIFETNPDYIDVSVQLKFAELEKKRKAIRLDELKIEKQEGLLIPTDAVKTLFLFSVETWNNVYMQQIDGLLNILIERTGGSHEQYIEAKKDLHEFLKNLKKETKKTMLDGIIGIVEEYQEIKGFKHDEN